MTLLFQANSSDPPIGALLVAALVKDAVPVDVEWSNVTCLKVNNEVSFTTSATIGRYLVRLAPRCGLYRNTALGNAEVDHWITFSLSPLSCHKQFIEALNHLDGYLGDVRGDFLVGDSLSLADVCVWGALYGNGEWRRLENQSDCPPRVRRWYQTLAAHAIFKAVVEGIPPEVQKAVLELRDGDATAKKIKSQTNPSGQGQKSSKKDEGKFVELPGAEMGKVVVRFPPEASGYLHIGHAKAALLNQHYQHAFNGKLIMRFDDTNPSKETEEFERVILEDVKMLEIQPDVFSHTSDYFDLMLSHCEKLIREGKAYCDDTDADTMKQEREKKVESKNRNNGIDINLKVWEEMKKGTEYGQTFCVRAKIDMQSVNGCMRDPTIYRCKNEPHLRTGHRYKVYPTYDFACPIVDSVEGVTHALRTTEYHDRDEQYYWFIKQLDLRNVYVWEYSRLNMTNTVLSKRKLTWFVNEGLVDGWDDPRFPTVRGVLRRGMTVEGLKQFIMAQGSSRSVVTMEWDKIWSFNKKVVDPVAPRYTALEKDGIVPVTVNGVSETSTRLAKHPKNEAIGTKTLWLGPKIMIDGEDADTLKEGENVTFIGWGNLFIRKLTRDENGRVARVEADPNLENTDFKKTLKLTWLADTESAPALPCVCVYFDHIISKAVLDKDDDFKKYIARNTRIQVEMLGDPELKNLKKGDIIQLQRRGFFICDSPYQPISRYSGRESPVILFYVPDGHSKELPTLGLKKRKEISPKEAAQSARGKSAEKSPVDEEMPLNDTGSSDVSVLDEKIKAQGDKVRQLKSEGVAKDAIAAEVKTLLGLKSQYKEVAGADWKPASGKPAVSGAANAASKDRKPKAGGDNQKEAPKSGKAAVAVAHPDAIELKSKIDAQGEKVRALKTSGGAAAEVDKEVKTLLELKQRYKDLTGEDLAGGKSKSGKKDAKKDKKQETKAALAAKPKKAEEQAAEAGANVEAPASGVKKVTRLGLEASKEENFSEWYSQVITKAEMIEYYDISGCYIFRPWSYSIWEFVTRFFDSEIKKLGVQNCYFPMFVSQSALHKEKTHIDDFAPEVAWVTKSGNSELAEPIAIRPTSETVMYPSFAKWIKSHRDLPLKLNQWNSVVRWEFKHPQPFLRTREFLWQEGHSAFASLAEAEEEVYAILELYRRVYEDLLAIPVVPGKKTKKEQFAGADYTTTVEGYIAATGRGLQGATSHHLGQNFAKMVDIVFEDPETNEKKFVFQNSWGLSTRCIGAMVMVHGDNTGLILPPNVACIQVVIVPCGITVTISDEDRESLNTRCKEYEARLVQAGVRCHGDYRDNYSPGWKFNHWELKGVPIRMEIGPRDVKQNQFVAVRRDTGEKLTLKEAGLEKRILDLLKEIHGNLYERAKKDLDTYMVTSRNWDEFCEKLDKKCIIQVPFCGNAECEDIIKKNSAREEGVDGQLGPSMGAKSLCIPFKQPEGDVTALHCINPSCERKPQFYTLFGRSY